jgi:HSP20 family protein
MNWKRADRFWGTPDSFWPLGRLQDEIGPWFEAMFGSARKGSPAVDVIDGPDEVIVRAELPGVDPAKIELSVAGNVLTLAGEKSSELEVKGEGFIRSECSYGSFRRSIPLPEGVDENRVNASFSKGVLTVRIGRAKGTPKRIPISEE